MAQAAGASSNGNTSCASGHCVRREGRIVRAVVAFDLEGAMPLDKEEEDALKSDI